MGAVVIGVDPHKLSNTIEVLDPDAVVLAAGRFSADREGYRSMLALGRRYESRRWAVEGCNGVGKHLAQRLGSVRREVSRPDPRSERHNPLNAAERRS